MFICRNIGLLVHIIFVNVDVSLEHEINYRYFDLRDLTQYGLQDEIYSENPDY